MLNMIVIGSDFFRQNANLALIKVIFFACELAFIYCWLGLIRKATSWLD